MRIYCTYFWLNTINNYNASLLNRSILFKSIHLSKSKTYITLESNILDEEIPAQSHPPKALSPCQIWVGDETTGTGNKKKLQMKGREIRPLCDGILNIRGLIDADKWVFNLGQGIERGCRCVSLSLFGGCVVL